MRQLNFETGYPVVPIWRNENDRAMPNGLLSVLYTPYSVVGTA